MKRETKVKIYVICLVIAGFYLGFIAGNIAMKYKCEMYIEANER